MQQPQDISTTSHEKPPRLLLCLIGATAVALLIASCVESPEQTGEPFDEDRLPIVGGTVEYDHEAVGALVIDDGWWFESFCSGTLITSRWVITAAHCLVHDGVEIPTWGIGFFVGTDSTNRSSGTIYDAMSFHVHPDYDETGPWNDIALVRLTSAASATPIDYNISPIGDRAGEEVTWVGFGISDPPWDGAGIKRLGTGDISGTSWFHLIYFDGQIPCSGDSGGAAMMDIDGEERVIGVISTADEDCVEGGTSTRVDPYGLWIQSVIESDPYSADCDLLGGDCGAHWTCLPGDEGETFCMTTLGLGVDEECDPRWEEWLDPPCEDGLICKQTSPMSISGSCRPMCFEDDDCEGNDSCNVPLYANVDDLGTCHPCIDRDRDGVCVDDDCDDTDERAFPGNTEVCFDLVDNDCNGETDEGCEECTDNDEDTYCDTDDCNDEDKDINPGADEICDDEVDNDCDEAIDDDDTDCGGSGDGDADGDADGDTDSDADADSDGDEGCSCAAPGQTPPSTGEALLALILGVLVFTKKSLRKNGEVTGGAWPCQIWSEWMLSLRLRWTQGSCPDSGRPAEARRRARLPGARPPVSVGMSSAEW